MGPVLPFYLHSGELPKSFPALWSAARDLVPNTQLEEIPSGDPQLKKRSQEGAGKYSINPPCIILLPNLWICARYLIQCKLLRHVIARHPQAWTLGLHFTPSDYILKLSNVRLQSCHLFYIRTNAHFKAIRSLHSCQILPFFLVLLQMALSPQHSQHVLITGTHSSYHPNHIIQNLGVHPFV